MNHTFLYVEDDAMSREIMQMIMIVAGHSELTVFEDSSDFMERVNALKPAPTVIFLDVHIHPIDGFEMLRLLREAPNFHNCIVIALTASVMNEEVAQLQTVGFNGAIGKPLDFEQFPQLLESILRGEAVWHVT